MKTPNIKNADKFNAYKEIIKLIDFFAIKFEDISQLNKIYRYKTDDLNLFCNIFIIEIEDEDINKNNINKNDEFKL